MLIWRDNMEPINNTQNNDKRLTEILETESLRVQESEWVAEEIRRQREIEDEIRQRLLEEQRILDERKRSIDENLTRTGQVQRFNEEHKKQISTQVYGLYGVSEDKLDGRTNYKRGLFKGCAGMLLVLSIALTGVCGAMHSFDDNTTLLLAMLTVLQAALLPRYQKNSGLTDGVSQFLYMLMFPGMLTIFIANEVGYSNYDFVKEYVVIGAVVIAAFATISFFEIEPYKGLNKSIRAAKKDLKIISNDAEKNVRKNQKLRKKFEKKEAKRLRREEAKEIKLRSREEAKRIRAEHAQAKLDAKEAARIEKEELRRQKETDKLLVEEAKKQEELARKEAEEARKAEEERLRVEEEARKAEAERLKAEEEAKKAEAERVKAEEEAKKAEAERIKAEEEAKLADVKESKPKKTTTRRKKKPEVDENGEIKGPHAI